MGQGTTLALAFAAVLGGALWISSGVRNRSLSDILHGITSPGGEDAGSRTSPYAQGSLPVGASASSIRKYFEGKGLSKAQAAGIVGNFQQESGLNPQEAGGGLDQGQGSRYHPGSLTDQLNAIWGELEGSERGTLGMLKQTKTPQAAARVFSEHFERPGIPDLANREQYALAASR